MGRFDSSLTRVQPVFNALFQHDASGETWLRSLLDMATRRGITEPATIPATLGHLIGPPQFEFPADPPKSFLGWLIKHPTRLSRPPESEWRKWNQRTQEKRYALLAEEAAVQAEAIAQLEGCPHPPRQAWWRLEGVTRVDCALLTPSTAVFVEGKRTEMGPSKGVVWYPKRNQVLRVLDCASAFAQQTGRPHYFVILVVEKDLVEGDLNRQCEIETVTSPETVRTSLPHLTGQGREEFLRHYLGMATWQDIVERFDLGMDILIDRVDG